MAGNRSIQINGHLCLDMQVNKFHDRYFIDVFDGSQSCGDCLPVSDKDGKPLLEQMNTNPVEFKDDTRTVRVFQKSRYKAASTVCTA